MKAHFYDLEAKDAHGSVIKMSELEGKVILIVNTASECGFRNQLSEMETLYHRYKDEGFRILAFPSDNFKNQEPLTAPEAEAHYYDQYAVTFQVMEKVIDKGRDIHPLFKYLTEGKSGLLTNRIKWNFTKFLVSREGRILHRYPPQKSPLAIEEDIKLLLRGR